jgi:hypothetical protein
MKNYSLIVSVPDTEPTLYELRGDRVGLGRELDNQIRLKMSEVSSSHCEFRKLEGGGYEVVDLDSTNGTRVNGKQIEKYTLADGDRLLLGEVVPVHFVELAEGEKPADVAVDAGEGGKAAAAAYTKMDEKLQSMAIELEALQKEYDDKKAEHGRMASSLKDLEATIAEKKASGEDAEEIHKMEMDLMAQTRRVQVMATDLQGQAQQLQALQGGAPIPLTPAAAAAQQQRQPPVQPVQPVVPVPMSAPGQALPVQPAAMQPPAQPQAQPVQPVPMQAPPQQAPAQPALAAIPIQPQGSVPVVNPLVTPQVPSGPQTTLLTPGAAPPGAPKTKRLLVEEPDKPKGKLNFGK